MGDGSTHRPTGRVVVFPNSIVFQANGNFCRQTPGTNFVWNEFKLTLAPECDYRLAEKRPMEVVENVYSPYRDAVQSQCRELERDLNMKLESPTFAGLTVALVFACIPLCAHAQGAAGAVPSTASAPSTLTTSVPRGGLGR